MGSFCECQALYRHPRLLWKANVVFYELYYLTLQATDINLFNFALAKKNQKVIQGNSNS